MTQCDAPPPLSRWETALMAARLFAIDPAGLGGVSVIAGPGPVRDLWLERLRGALASGAPVRRVPAHIEDDRLIGAVDLTATLASGRVVLQMGILGEADGGIVLIPMAERLSAGVAARIAAVLDRRELVVEREGLARRIPARIGVVAFDEGVSPEERLAVSLRERFAFHLDLRDLSARGLANLAIDPSETAAARLALASVEGPSADVVEALVATAAAFGINSVVAPLLALRAARVAAALAGRRAITEEDAVLAARLVLAPRSQMMPDEAPDETEPPAPPDDPGADEDGDDDDDDDTEPATEPPNLEDIMLAAVQAAVPDDLLAKLKTGAGGPQPTGRNSRLGAAKSSALRGRPTGVRMGALRPGSRLALVATLRAAAPWQAVRRNDQVARTVSRPIEVRREDFRFKRFAQRRESTMVFCVDASGSTAFHRLAESKGAVEMLLAEAYVNRTFVSLVAFRGHGAELLLPPTRSLTRAKALLANLPGGGGTPLAAGVDCAVLVALAERSKSREPLVILLTDGRANITADGQAARGRAMEEALDSSRRLAAQRIAAVFIDTSARPRAEGSDLAAAMNARYVALPYVEASAVCDVARGAASEFFTEPLRPR
ncbi:MAG TPA: magnesium chelatase subunit D [Rhodospirillaceae bacterium]|nr:magnesium chelatase subunit D [Rhodospirillaceae bacterium]